MSENPYKYFINMNMFIAKFMHHKWEEEPISGIANGYEGTFAIFFYGCNMDCVYCQNSKISKVKISELNENNAIILTPMELAKKMVDEEKNSNIKTISLITGALYIDLIVETINIAKQMGLKTKIVYNSSGYELKENIKKLDGLIDIYLPDFKYFDNELAKKYSGRKNYVEVAKDCIKEMYNQVGGYDIEKNIDRGVIVRNLLLPQNTENSKKVLKYLYDTYGNDICYSIMSQYTPIIDNHNIGNYKELLRKVTKREYDKVVDYAMNLGITNAFIQDIGASDKCYIPDF